MGTRRGSRGGKSDRHFVKLDNQMVYLPSAKWHSWIAAGLLILISACVAEPACAGVIWLENGELHERQEPIAPYMQLNCRVIERHAIFDVKGPRLTPEQLQKAIQRNYRGID